MTQPLRFVPAGSGLTRALADLERVCFSDPWSEADFGRGLDNPLLCTLAALDAGDRVCGYLTGSLLPPEGEIWRLAVSPDCRRAGIGRALTETFLKIGGQRNCERFYLEVRASNSAAIGLYAACGFVPCGRRRNYYKNPAEDAVLMQLTRKGEGVSS